MRVVFRLRPVEFKRLSVRAARLGLGANDYARERALGRVRPPEALRRAVRESGAGLAELGAFVDFADQLLRYLERHHAEESELGQVVRRARGRFADPPGVLASLRALIEQAARS